MNPASRNIENQPAQQAELELKYLSGENHEGK